MRTCRVETERRIVALASQLPDWTGDQGEAKSSETPRWWVTPVPDQIELGRTVVIGVEPDAFDGDIEPTAIAGTTAPADDVWSITGVVFAIGEGAYPPYAEWDERPAPWRAKQVVEDAIGDLREMLAANHRLAIGNEPTLGVYQVTLSGWRGPWYSAPDNGDAGAFARFTIDCRAQLRAGANP